MDLTSLWSNSSITLRMAHSKIWFFWRVLASLLVYLLHSMSNEIGAGIPDFRSSTGLYNTISNYHVPPFEDPSIVFDLRFFQVYPGKWILYDSEYLSSHLLYPLLSVVLQWESWHIASSHSCSFPHQIASESSCYDSFIYSEHWW